MTIKRERPGVVTRGVVDTVATVQSGATAHCTTPAPALTDQPEAVPPPVESPGQAADLPELVAVLTRLADVLDAQRQPATPRLAYRLIELSVVVLASAQEGFG